MEKIKTNKGTIKFKEGTLRKQLKMKNNQKFTKSKLSILKKIPIGKKFKFNSYDFKMTKLLKQRVNLGLTLMSFK
jgi:hypothetical protein